MKKIEKKKIIKFHFYPFIIHEYINRYYSHMYIKTAKYLILFQFRHGFNKPFVDLQLAHIVFHISKDLSLKKELEHERKELCW